MNDAIRRLAAATGVDSDLSDEHGRWSVLRRAISTRSSMELLREAIATEPLAHIRGAAVTEVLDRVPNDEHPRWLALVETEIEAKFCSQRSVEIGIARRAEDGQLGPTEVQSAIEGWSRHLQERICRRSEDPAVLAVFVARGKTRVLREVADLRRADLLGRTVSDHQAEVLFDELCSQMGYCVPPDDRAQLTATVPDDVDAFIDAVVRAEGGESLFMDEERRRQARRLVRKSFERDRNRRRDLLRGPA